MRKQNEATQTRIGAKFAGIVNPNLSKAKTTAKSSERKEKPVATVKAPNTSAEDEKLYQKSQRVLRAKSKFYDKMMASGGSLNSDDTCLVMFSEKKANDIGPMPIYDLPPDDSPPRRLSTSSESSSSSSSSVASNNFVDDDDSHLPDDERWVEYTDCLGRTRKCLKKDLEFFRKKDGELARESDVKEEGERERSPTPEIERKPKATGLSYLHPNPNFLPPTDRESKLETMRQNWEKKEMENVERDEIHYQDVLFDEARSHGIGYYQFSQDEDERAKQQAQLQAERDETIAAQRKREEQIQNREKIIAERVRAAKNRQRARLGLPPLEEVAVKIDEAKEKKERKAEEKRKRKEREKEERLEEEERRNAKVRRQHVRPWDKGKTGSDHSPHKHDLSDSDDDLSEWKYKPEKEPMTQEQWIALQRDSRNANFAPPPSSMAGVSVSGPTKVPDVRESGLSSKTEFGASGPNYSTTMTRNQRVRRNAEFEPPSITATMADRLATGDSGGQYSSVPFEYASNYRPPQNRPRGAELETSIAAGLRFLREQSDKHAGSNKHTWTGKADY